ncbi:MAG: phosphopantothenoylcysteine decarboxylase [Candidatus Omnitrophota bacterium]|nr:MAG: phosphopantothenoylcysteine decarboxylase [Candidatus Omnitrophota bacterium]
MGKVKEVIVCVAASISAYKACDLVRILTKKNFSVRVLMTPEAVNFIQPLTFSTLSYKPVFTDMFADTFINGRPLHIALARQADLIVVVPATANVIAKLACGICDDLVTGVIIAAKTKIMVCPAMNDYMYNHPATKINLQKIKEFGYQVISPSVGQLADGKVGIGHLAEIALISAKIEEALK